MVATKGRAKIADSISEAVAEVSENVGAALVVLTIIAGAALGVALAALVIASRR